MKHRIPVNYDAYIKALEDKTIVYFVPVIHTLRSRKRQRTLDYYFNIEREKEEQPLGSKDKKNLMLEMLYGSAGTGVLKKKPIAKQKLCDAEEVTRNFKKRPCCPFCGSEEEPCCDATEKEEKLHMELWTSQGHSKARKKNDLAWLECKKTCELDPHEARDCISFRCKKFGARTDTETALRQSTEKLGLMAEEAERTGNLAMAIDIEDLVSGPRKRKRKTLQKKKKKDGMFFSH